VQAGLEEEVACSSLLSKGKGRHQQQDFLHQFSGLLTNPVSLSYWKNSQLEETSPMHRQDWPCYDKEPGRVGAEHPTGEGDASLQHLRQRGPTAALSMARTADLTAAVSC